MKNYSYIFSAIGWIGFATCLILIILLDKCKGPAPTIVNEKVINTYYDSVSKPVPVVSYVPGPVITITVPAGIDTARILATYFSKTGFTRRFENDTISATIIDTIGMNQLLSPGQFSYRWKIPVKTVESTTVTISREPTRRLQLLVGAFGQFQKNQVTGIGPELYLQGKRGNLYGANYDVLNRSFGIKTAININEAFGNKKR